MDTKQAYANLSNLIFKGFLTTGFNLDGELLVFKTVNEKEFDLIKLYAGNPESRDYSHKFNVFFIIFSLFLLNGENVLKDREDNIVKFYDHFSKLPGLIIKQFILNLNEIRIISFEVIKYLEGFCYTGYARNSWRTLRGHLPTAQEFTGIPGTSNLGLNAHQESWITINRALDLEDINMEEFSRAIMIASASNPKGARHVQSQHDSSKRLYEERRKKLAVEGFIDTKKWSENGWAASVDTTEEIVAELERQMTGKKDKHDLFMERYMKQIKDMTEKKAQEAEENIKKYHDNCDNVFIEGSQRELSKEESRNVGKKEPTYVVEVPSEEETSPEDKDRFYSKIGARVLSPK